MIGNPFVVGVVADALRDFYGWKPGGDDRIGAAEHVVGWLQRTLEIDLGAATEPAQPLNLGEEGVRSE